MEPGLCSWIVEGVSTTLVAEKALPWRAMLSFCVGVEVTIGGAEVEGLELSIGTVFTSIVGGAIGTSEPESCVAGATDDCSFSSRELGVGFASPVGGAVGLFELEPCSDATGD